VCVCVCVCVQETERERGELKCLSVHYQLGTVNPPVR